MDISESPMSTSGDMDMGSVHVGWRFGLVRAQGPKTASKLHSGAKIRRRQSVENRKQKRLPRGKKGACLVPSSDMVKREELAFATARELSQLPECRHIYRSAQSTIQR